jgi:hypothetical protein
MFNANENRRRLRSDPKWRRAELDRDNAARRARYPKHKIKISEQNHRSYVKHRTVRIANAVQYAKDHPKNPEKERLYQREYAMTPKRKSSRRKYLYGLTPEQYENMIINQGFKCAICGIHETAIKGKRRLCIDHCHTTGKVRGLLCPNCNLMLGTARDNPDYLREGAKYLETGGPVAMPAI